MITAAQAGFNQKISGFGTLSYVNGDPSITSMPYIDYGGSNTTADVVFLDETMIEPYPPSQPSREVDDTYILTVCRFQAAWKWSLNENHSYDLSLDPERPLLWNPKPALNQSLVISTKNDTWVDIIFMAPGDAHMLQPSHPIHKHSNKAYVIVSFTRASFQCVI